MSSTGGLGVMSRLSEMLVKLYLNIGKVRDLYSNYKDYKDESIKKASEELSINRTYIAMRCLRL